MRITIVQSLPKLKKHLKGTKKKTNRCKEVLDGVRITHVELVTDVHEETPVLLGCLFVCGLLDDLKPRTSLPQQNLASTSS